MVKVLVVSNLYPNAEQAYHGIFTENRLRHLLKDADDIEIQVISPIASFPLKSFSAGPYAHLRKVPKQELRYDIKVHYPRYINIPKIGMKRQPVAMAKALIRQAQRIKNDGFDFDIIDCYYFYPDGVAASILAQHFEKPLLITAYGNDISLIPQNPFAAEQMVKASHQAVASSAVCQALKDEMVNLGMDENKVFSILHGVDLELFRPSEDRTALREKLCISGKTLLSVGHLIERKGFEYSIEALCELHDCKLLIAGDGPDRVALQRHAERLGVHTRVKFLGRLPQAELSEYFKAVDAFVLMSSREGIPNVLMESIACGTPVVASAVWGIPEVLTEEAGVLVHERSATALAKAVEQLFQNPPQRVREYAENFTWTKTSDQHRSLYDLCLQRA